MFLSIFNSNSPMTKTQILRGDTAPQGLGYSTRLAILSLAEAHGTRTGRELSFETTPRSRRTRGGYVPISGSGILPYLCNSNNPRTKTQIPRVDTAPESVENTTQLAGCYLSGAHGASTGRELPLGTTPRSRPIRGG